METTKHPKLKRPSSSRNSIWSHFGFPLDSTTNVVLSRSEILCCLCHTPFIYNAKDSSDLRLHLDLEHTEVVLSSERHQTGNQANPERRGNSVVVELGDESEAALEDAEIYEDDGQIEYLIEHGMEVEADDDEPPVEDVKPSTVQLLKAQRSTRYVDLSKGLAEMCITDLISPVIVDGKGFSQWIQTVKPNAYLLGSEQIWERIYDLYDEKITSANQQIDALLGKGSHFALAIDMWSNAKAKPRVSLSVYYETADRTGYASIDNFISFDADRLGPEDWKTQFEWFHPERCSAAVLNFEADEHLREFMRQNDVPIFMCFSTVIGRIVERCSRLPCIHEALLTADLEFRILDSTHAKHLWLFGFTNIEEYLRSEFVSAKDGEQKAIQLLERLVKCLTPFKMVLETVKNEKHPVASLIQPLANQLLANYFDDNDQGWDIINEIVQDEFQKHIINNEYLSIVSFLDPRFHNLCDADQVLTIKSKLQTMCPADQFVPITPKAERRAPPPPPPPSASGLSLFFKKPPAKPRRDRDSFDVEFESYSAIHDVPLEQRPQDWWTSNAKQYPRLNAAAKLLLCSPAILENPITNDETLFERRSQIEGSTSNSRMLALHSFLAKQQSK